MREAKEQEKLQKLIIKVTVSGGLSTDQCCRLIVRSAWLGVESTQKDRG